MVAFTPMEKVRGLVGKEAKDFFREVLAEEPFLAMLPEGLEVAVVPMELVEVLEEAEATLEEVAEVI